MKELQQEKAEQDKEKEGRPANPVHQRSQACIRKHAEETRQLAGTLTPAGATPVESELYFQAAHEGSMLRAIGASEVAVAEQIQLLLSSGQPKHVPALTRALLDLGKVRTETTRRSLEILKTADALAARRRIAAMEESRSGSHLRRVV